MRRFVLFVLLGLLALPSVAVARPHHAHAHHHARHHAHHHRAHRANVEEGVLEVEVGDGEWEAIPISDAEGRSLDEGLTAEEREAALVAEATSSE